MQSNKEPNYRASDINYSAGDSRASVSMNLASAYPDEAGIVRWIRTLTLDRTADRIHLLEDFRLRKMVPIQLSFMTPRLPTQESGQVVFSAADKSAHGVALRYDKTLIVPTIERIALTDDWLVGRWGKTIYRVLLTSVAPTDNGKWAIELS